MYRFTGNYFEDSFNSGPLNRANDFPLNDVIGFRQFLLKQEFSEIILEMLRKFN